MFVFCWTRIYSVVLATRKFCVPGRQFGPLFCMKIVFQNFWKQEWRVHVGCSFGVPHSAPRPPTSVWVAPRPARPPPPPDRVLSCFVPPHSALLFHTQGWFGGRFRGRATDDLVPNVTIQLMFPLHPAAVRIERLSKPH